jgi:hypothetical protein
MPATRLTLFGKPCKLSMCTWIDSTLGRFENSKKENLMDHFGHAQPSEFYQGVIVLLSLSMALS